MGDLQDWEAVYYATTLAARAVAQLPAVAELAADSLLKDLTATLLTHPHAWVQRAAGRLLGILFGRLDPATLAPSAYLAARPRLRLVEIARALLIQLASPNLSADATEQLAKNLFFVARSLALGQTDDADDTAKDDEEDDGEEKDEEEEEEEEEDDDDDHGDDTTPPNPLEWLCKRLAFRARKGTPNAHASVRSLQLTVVFRWTAGVATVISADETRTVLLPTVLPALMHTLEATTQASTSTD